MPKHKVTKRYAREGVEWQGKYDDQTHDMLMQVLEQQRSTLVKDTRAGKPVENFYQVGRDLLDDLPLEGYESAASAFPDLGTYMEQDQEQQARLMQRLLTELSNRLDPVPIPPDPKDNSGGGGGGGGKSPPQPQPPQPPQKSPQSKAPPKPPTPQPPQPQPGTSPPEEPAEVPFTEPGEDNPFQHSGEDDEGEMTPAHGGGGRSILGNPEELPIFNAIRDLLTKLAFDIDWAETLPDGSQKWALGRVLRGHYNPSYLRQGKEDYATTVDEVYLSLDTSGSVSSLAKVVASIAAGSAGIVHLYHGEEGHPEYKVLKREPLKYPGQPFPEWTGYQFKQPIIEETTAYHEFREDFRRQWAGKFPALVDHEIGWHHDSSFEENLAWFLHVEKPAPGSFLLFWGDTEVVDFAAPELLRALLRPYKFAWLFPYDEGWADNYYSRYDENIAGQGAMSKVPASELLARPHHGLNTRAEYRKLLAVELPVIYNVRDAVGIREALRRLQTIK